MSGSAPAAGASIPPGRRLAVAGLALLVAVALGALLHASYCAFSWGRFRWVDYGRYLNVLWNLAHGHGWTYAVDQSYFTTHLSFTLLPVAWLLRIWDHPFLPAAAQWLGLAGGTAILLHSARRMGIPSILSLAVALFYVAWPFTQTVMLSEFHGVALYFLLVPLIHFTLRFHPAWTLLPLGLLLGLREDAFVIVLPLLGWIAVTRRHRAGWALFALTAVYGVLAIFVLFPALAGTTLNEIRPVLDSGAAWKRSWTGAKLLARLQTLAWVALSLLPLLGRRAWKPLVILPSLAILTILLSSVPKQIVLAVHYPAGFMAVLGVAMIEAADRLREAPRPRTDLRAAALVVLAIAAHFSRGIFIGGGQSDRVYTRVHPDGVQQVQIAATLPKDGVLFTTDQMTGFAANRRDIRPPRHYDPDRDRIDLVFLPVKHAPDALGGTLMPALRDGSWGVLKLEGRFFTAARGANPAGNAAFLALFETPP